MDWFLELKEVNFLALRNGSRTLPPCCAHLPALSLGLTSCLCCPYPPQPHLCSLSLIPAEGWGASHAQVPPRAGT